ncbi:MAG: hypothetical protein WCF57_16715 [Pyrinomonadaceae bacterium]
MKRCPSCQQTYDEDTLSFCPADGTRLESERSPSMDMQATIMAPPPSVPASLSQPLSPESLSGYETNVSSPPPPLSSFETTTPPMQTPSWETLPGAASTPPQQGASAEQGFKRPKPMVAYITIGAAIVIAGFLLLVWLIGLIAGVGGFIHLLFLLALLIGFVGIAAGVAMLFMGKKQ